MTAAPGSSPARCYLWLTRVILYLFLYLILSINVNRITASTLASFSFIHKLRRELSIFLRIFTNICQCQCCFILNIPHCELEGGRSENSCSEWLVLLQVRVESTLCPFCLCTGLEKFYCPVVGSTVIELSVTVAVRILTLSLYHYIWHQELNTPPRSRLLTLYEFSNWLADFLFTVTDSRNGKYSN